jgi:hypothetical protein
VKKKICAKCKIYKPGEQFVRRRKRRRRPYSYCEECRNKVSAAYHEQLKQKRLEIKCFIYKYLLSHPCACGESAPEALEFDHRRDKKFDISHAAKYGYGMAVVQREIEKCVVMCSNCHRKKTAAEQHWYASVRAMLDNKH